MEESPHFFNKPWSIRCSTFCWDCRLDWFFGGCEAPPMVYISGEDGGRCGSAMFSCDREAIRRCHSTPWSWSWTNGWSLQWTSRSGSSMTWVARTIDDHWWPLGFWALPFWWFFEEVMVHDPSARNVMQPTIKSWRMGQDWSVLPDEQNLCVAAWVSNFFCEVPRMVGRCSCWSSNRFHLQRALGLSGNERIGSNSTIPSSQQWQVSKLSTVVSAVAVHQGRPSPPRRNSQHLSEIFPTSDKMAGCLWWCQRAPLKGASKLFWVFFWIMHGCTLKIFGDNASWGRLFIRFWRCCWSSRTDDLIIRRAAAAADDDDDDDGEDDDDPLQQGWRPWALPKLWAHQTDWCPPLRFCFRSASQCQVNPMLGDQNVLTCPQ